MQILQYLDSLIMASELNGVKPVIISIMVHPEVYDAVIEEMSSMNSVSRPSILDNPEERGMFIEYSGFKFRIYKPQ